VNKPGKVENGEGEERGERKARKKRRKIERGRQTLFETQRGGRKHRINVGGKHQGFLRQANRAVKTIASCPTGTRTPTNKNITRFPGKKKKKKIKKIPEITNTRRRIGTKNKKAKKRTKQKKEIKNRERIKKQQKKTDFARFDCMFSEGASAAIKPLL